MYNNPLENVFAGENGVVNTLFNLLGHEATVETITKREYNEEKDAYIEDKAVQIVPFLAGDMTGNLQASQVPEAVSAGLVATEYVFTGYVATATLNTAIKPLKTNIIFRGEKYQVVTAKPEFVGGITHSFFLTMRKV